MAKKLPPPGNRVDTSDMAADRRQTSSERRRAARIPFIAAVKHHIGEELRLGLALNLGLGGIALRSAPGQSLKARTHIELQFDLPDGGELVHVTGIVMFSKLYGAFQTSGIKFENIAPDVHNRIQALIGDQIGDRIGALVAV